MFTRFRRLVWPPTPEPIPLSVWLRAATARMYGIPALGLIAIVARFFVQSGGSYDPAAYDRFLWLLLPAQAVIVALAVAVQRWARAPAHFRNLTALSVVAECWTALAMLWLLGSLTSSVAVIWLVFLVGFYRLYYNSAFGLWAFVAVSASHIGLVVAELADVTESGVLTVGFSNPVYSSASLMTVYLMGHLAMYFATWVAACVAAKHFSDLHTAHGLGLTNTPGGKNGRLSGVTLDGAYELEQLIGRGGMGEVYLAWRLRDGKPVAVKVLHPIVAEDSEMLQRFQREAEAAARVAPGHVSEIYGIATTDDGITYVAMEYLRGEQLGLFLERHGRLSLDDTAALCLRLADALEAVHAAGIIHRDLKPGNVFVIDHKPKHLDLRLLDFGIAKLRGDAAIATHTSAILGSPGFMAPEQADSRRDDYGPYTDVFALGVITYRALTGEYPFAVHDPVLAVYETLRTDPVPPSSLRASLTPRVDAAVARALAKSPNERFQSANAFARALCDALEDADRDFCSAELAPTVAGTGQLAATGRQRSEGGEEPGS